MRSNNKHTPEELEAYIQMYLKEQVSYRTLKTDYGLLLSDSLFYEKVLKYEKYGLTGIQSKLFNNHYSDTLKHAIVQEYIEGDISIRELACKYNIPSKSTVRDWIIRYTKDKESRTNTPKSEVYTMTGRKTTHEEKVIIVNDYLSNHLSYKDAAEKYNVSYNNIYSWVQKYKEYGPDGLIDGRGRRKPDSIQTDEEKLRTEIAALKARNDYLETENAALKKLKETERELMLRKRDMKQNIIPFKSSKN